MQNPGDALTRVERGSTAAGEHWIAEVWLLHDQTNNISCGTVFRGQWRRSIVAEISCPQRSREKRTTNESSLILAG